MGEHFGRSMSICGTRYFPSPRQSPSSRGHPANPLQRPSRETAQKTPGHEYSLAHLTPADEAVTTPIDPVIKQVLGEVEPPNEQRSECAALDRSH